MKKVFALTVIFVTLIAALLFWEGMRLNFWRNNELNGSFVSITCEEAKRL